MANLHYKTYQDMAFDIKANIHKVPEDIDLIVGIPRSGIIPAYMIALALNKPACSIREFINTNFDTTAKSTFRIKLKNDIKNVFVIDDSVNTGRAIETVRSEILKHGLDKKYNITYGAVYYKPESKNLVDIALCICPQPRMFQWNYLNHSNLSRAALDIDGVLCVDPNTAQNDDGPEYKQFLLNAKPLYIPQYKVAALVTSRLEQYRPETEAWLAKHNVQYGKLYMLRGKTAEERRQQNLHAVHKAAIYKKLQNTNIFVESEPAQAREIARLTGKLCFCSKTDELFGLDKPDNFSVHSNKSLITSIWKKLFRH